MLLLSLILLAFAELEFPSCLPASWLLAFHHARIAGEQAFFSQGASVLAVDLHHGACNAQANRLGLSLHATALNIDSDIVVPFNFHSGHCLLDSCLEDLRFEVIIQVAI